MAEQQAEQTARRYHVRTSWAGWMRGAQTLLWPDKPLPLAHAAVLLRLARAHSTVVLATYDIVDASTGAAVPEASAAGPGEEGRDG